VVYGTDLGSETWLSIGVFIQPEGFLVIFLGAFVGGLLGIFGSWVFPDGWESIRFHCAELGVSDVSGFVRVAWIHNAGYLGALLGLIGALLWIHRKSGSFSQIA
jgi:hypothetical protein